MESHLTKHVLPRFGHQPLDFVTETRLQEFVADLGRATFEMKKPDGSLIKTYRLSRKTILNIVGVIKIVLGRKIWMAWELDLGKPNRPKQRYFTDEQLKLIIDAAPGQYRVLFSLLTGTGMRIGEAAGLHVDDIDLDNRVIYVRRGVWKGQELEPKTDNAFREIDIDPTLAQMLKDHIGGRTTGRLFSSRRGTPLAHGNLRKRVLTPLLRELNIPRAGLHAFRHSRVTMLRKNGTPRDLQKQWIGHSSLRTGDRYSHTSEELQYRKDAAGSVGIDRVLGPHGPQTDAQTAPVKKPLKATA
jgi:integrase